MPTMKISLSAKVAIGTFLIASVGVVIISFLSFHLMTKYFKENSLNSLNFELQEYVKNMKSDIDKIVYDANILKQSDNIIAFYRASINNYSYDAVTNTTRKTIITPLIN